MPAQKPRMRTHYAFVEHLGLEPVRHIEARIRKAKIREYRTPAEFQKKVEEIILGE